MQNMKNYENIFKEIKKMIPNYDPHSFDETFPPIKNKKHKLYMAGLFTLILLWTILKYMFILAVILISAISISYKIMIK